MPKLSNYYYPKLIDAITKNNIVKVKIYLQLVDINEKGQYSEPSFLETAITHEREQIAELLLQKGADPNIKTNYGDILTRAMFQGLPNVVKSLLLKGADPNKPDFTGNTPFMKACGHYINDFEMVRLFLQFGVDVNAKDIYGNTPLLSACHAKTDLKIIELLLENGADINVRNFHGLSPIDLSNQWSDKRAYHLLSTFSFKKAVNKAAQTCMVVQQGARQNNGQSILAILPTDILKEIYAYIFPCPEKKKESNIFCNNIVKAYQFKNTFFKTRIENSVAHPHTYSDRKFRSLSS